jgi:hypothetical protein
MRPVYAEATRLKRDRGAPLKRAEFIEQRVTKRDGVWLKVHDSIDATLDKMLKECEDVITKKIEELFDELHNDFLLLCAGAEPKEEKDKVQEEIMRTKLKENLATVKTMIEPGGAIPDLVAKCKQELVEHARGTAWVLVLPATIALARQAETRRNTLRNKNYDNQKQQASLSSSILLANDDFYSDGRPR